MTRLRDLTPDQIILGPRPGKKSFDRLCELGLSHVVTLLGERETPRNIGQISAKLGADWVWLPIDGGHEDTLRVTDFAGHLTRLQLAIADTQAPRLYVHCSAGIHRTGTFAWLILRLGGRSPEAAREALETMRSVTAAQVGEHRIALAEELLASEPLLSLATSL